MRRVVMMLMVMICTLPVVAQEQDRGALARAKRQTLLVKEWKTTPDGKNKWVDHTELYDAEGRLIEEREYADYGRYLSWRSTYEYNERGLLIKEVVYNSRGKVQKVRKFEYDSQGVCTRRYNYSPNGMLNSYRQFEYIYE